MKTKNWALVALSVLVLSFGASAQQDALTSPLASPDAARNWAHAHVVSGQLALSSPSMDWQYPGRVTYTNVTGKYAEDVLAQLAHADFKFRLTNPSDKVTEYLYLLDKDGNILFYGQNEFTLDQISGKDGVPKCEYWIQEIPLFEHVKAAQVLALLPDGSTGNITNMRVNEKGQLMWSPWMSGAVNGLLVIKFDDGSIKTYRLSNPDGGSSPGGSNVAGSQFGTPGHYVYKDPDSITILELWNRPTAFIEVTADRFITVDVGGAYQDEKGNAAIERPTAMEVVMTSPNGTVTSGVVTLQNGVNKLSFNKGTYRILFRWVKFGAPGTLYTGPAGVATPVDGGGGKG